MITDELLQQDVRKLLWWDEQILYETFPWTKKYDDGDSTILLIVPFPTPLST
jgi:hypothetical protein